MISLAPSNLYTLKKKDVVATWVLAFGSNIVELVIPCISHILSFIFVQYGLSTI